MAPNYTQHMTHAEFGRWASAWFAENPEAAEAADAWINEQADKAARQVAA